VQSFLRGDLCVLASRNWLPLAADMPGATVGALTTGVVTLDELNRWIASQGVPVKLSYVDEARHASVTRQSDGAHWNHDEKWRTAAHEFACRIAQRNRERGYGGSSHRDVAPEVTSELVKIGFPADVSSERVRKVLLKGWKYDPSTIYIENARRA
jgi:hypothetical protein